MHRHYRRRRHIGRALAAAGALSALIVLPTTISAASSAAPRSKSPLQQGLDFYRGKTITIIEPGATGAIFDLIARTEATFLGQYLHAIVNVEDVTIGNTIPGQDDTAGAPPDGLTLGLLNMGNDASLTLTHTPGLSFNPSRLEFIAATAPSASLMIAANSSPYSNLKSIVQASSPTVLMENTGTVDVLAASLLGIIKAHPNYVVGYTSIGSYVQGFVRGDGPIMMTNLASTGALVANGVAHSILVTAVPPQGTLYRQYATGVPTFAQVQKEYPPKTALEKREWKALDSFFGASSTPLVTQTSVASYKLAALRAASVWMFHQTAFKTQMLGEGQNPNYIDPVQAKSDYLTVLKYGTILLPFFSRFT